MNLNLAFFNAENFYLLLDRPLDRDELEALSEDEYQDMNASIYNPNKDRGKIAEIARVILERDFDLVGLCEIGGMETLAAFNHLYLGGRYDCFLHEENSRRGIFVGALVRKGRFREARASNLPGSFSRNLLRLDLLGPAGTAIGPSSRAAGDAEGSGLAVFVVHLKSQYGDDHGIGQRIREVGKLCGLVRPERCVVMGDFNGILVRGEAQFEYEAFLALPFRDVLEALGVPPALRRTHYHFGKEPHFAQLDYIFVSNDLRVCGGGVLEGEIPITRAQRATLPSDHLMIWASLGADPEPSPVPRPRTRILRGLLALLGRRRGHRPA